jgi:hypothetical protein
MTKKEALNMLYAARSAHIQWRARAQALVAGIPIEKEHVPISYTDCKFGRWYYGDGQQLSALLRSYRGIEEPHEKLHIVYMQIFNALYGEDNLSMLEKLFGAAKKHKAEKISLVERLLPQLIHISHTLLEAIDILEKEILSLPEEEFAQL